MGWATAFSFIILIFIITFIATLGRLGDFEELNSLVPTLLIAVLGLILLKPAYKYTMNKIKDTGKDGEPAAQEETNNGDDEQNLLISNDQITLATMQ